MGPPHFLKANKMSNTPDWLKVDEGQATITLSRQFKTADGQELAQLNMREPTVGDQRVASKSAANNVDQEVTLFANLLQLTPADLDRLPLKDYTRVQAAYRAFIN